MSATIANVQACIFDAYGTLFDVHSAVGKHRSRLASHSDEISALWRSKQLEYTWLRSLMQSHSDFWQVTGDALDYALAAYHVDDRDLRDDLMHAYLALDAYPEVPGMLKRLKDQGVITAILSNGSPQMLMAAVERAGLSNLLDGIYSVESVGVFKPDPSVYQYALDQLRLLPDQVSFQSSNGWDAYAASHFGMKVVWINRFNQAQERLPGQPDVILNDLSALPEVVSGG